jgi:hypothetical protein
MEHKYEDFFLDSLTYDLPIHAADNESVIDVMLTKTSFTLLLSYVISD